MSSLRSLVVVVVVLMLVIVVVVVLMLLAVGRLTATHHNEQCDADQHRTRA